MPLLPRRINERWEAVMRIPVALISGIILGLWKMVVEFVLIIHWFVVIITGKRNADLASFANAWITEYYKFVRYINFTTNERPFPFTPMHKPVEPVKK
ncbi:MAG: DUF4389 domain-containing protein [Candidatus Aenigmarchaeota archaeon]|nr:DUF4389 domain-containing protein [Candidatus Aenigmarchaeota archaeon]